ncbi:MAG: spore protease YyaC [Clostridia bacterium]|nr:spore protease YyaC [Clostridia bacterium]
MGGFSWWHRPAAALPEAALNQKIKYHYEDPDVVERLGEALIRQLSALNPDGRRPLVIVAIGTDRSTGDSLGPLVGSRLKDLSHGAIQVLGTLDEPVHAANLHHWLAYIEEHYPEALVVAIDASLGPSDSVGYITLAPGPLKPGAGVQKNLPSVGELHLTGTVNVGGYMEYLVLQNTRLSTVVKMANRIAEAICWAYQRLGALPPMPALAPTDTLR